MPEIISDTSCLIILDNIKRLEILKELYDEICIAEEVFKEFGQPVDSWIQVKKIKKHLEQLFI